MITSSDDPTIRTASSGSMRSQPQGTTGGGGGGHPIKGADPLPSSVVVVVVVEDEDEEEDCVHRLSMSPEIAEAAMSGSAPPASNEESTPLTRTSTAAVAAALASAEPRRHAVNVPAWQATTKACTQWSGVQPA